MRLFRVLILGFVLILEFAIRRRRQIRFADVAGCFFAVIVVGFVDGGCMRIRRFGRHEFQAAGFAEDVPAGDGEEGFGGIGEGFGAGGTVEVGAFAVGGAGGRFCAWGGEFDRDEGFEG